ncbi:PREDICTED: L-type lectin-domain containing receptor kinase IX.1-like [Prunus mume]|uniref:L-type lectin-domain containing receptor kinase IX.1-like n=1 Tax=Prunus mume TaxID=102107 RepID=A0ABM0NL95_PRUMU|nr:PREDICTED: L-type lectin-domain containing receptor kinase IX.1-like [Prunus mume]
MVVMGNSSAFITTNTLHSPKLHFLVLLFFLLTSSATPLNFSFSSFNGSDLATITTEGDAFFDTKILRLTNSGTDDENIFSVGRATYRQPFLLREKATGKLADFTTSFNFALDSNNNSKYGDGLAFFIAPNDSSLNSVLGKGGNLGLPVDTVTPNVIGPRNQYPFVAVEFDIYQNTRETIKDHAHEHVGINVNSLYSIITKNWTAGILNGTTNSAAVSYNSTTKNFSVAFTTFVDGVQVIHYLDYKVDLKDYLPDWVVVGFSASTGSSVALFKIFSWNFNSTSLVDRHEVKSGNDNRIGLIIGVSIGGCAVVLVGVLGLVWFILWKKRDGGESSDENPMVNELIDEEFEKRVGPRKFSYSELVCATSNFGEGEKLGEGGFGGVYKGFLPDLKSFVAVKRISMESKQGLKEYASEVKIISQLRHRHLVKLIGWCHERKFILVYEFMPNGSLDAHLFKEQRFLTWDARYKIALGLASGLLYLHEGWEQCVLHRDIKSSNVMLDSNFNAKLGDFGLARLVDHGQEPETTALAGTMGYMAPDYLNTGKASKESDVYSLGVVALEIACGRKAIDPKFGTGKINMVEWVWELHGEGRAIEAVDPKLCGDFDEEQMECLIIVGLWCAHPDYNMRPSIQQAIQMLNFEIPLPPLPSKMPAATYFTAPKSVSMLSRDTSGSQGGQTGCGHNTYTSHDCANAWF